MALLKDLREFFEQARQVKALAPTAYQPSNLRRFFRKWREFLVPGRNALDDEQPWVNFAASNFLESILRPEMRVFEYGSGGSTLFYGKRVQQVVAIEHDPAWTSQVRERLKTRGFSHCDVRLIPPEEPKDAASSDAADFNSYASSVKEYAGLSFEKYARSIEEFPDEFFSVVVVDGRARPSCSCHALAKVATGGFFLLDNAEREHYRRVEARLSNDQWKLHDFYGPGPYNRYFWRTCIWKKLE